MKILLPVSGCLDSSVLLVETLRYTDHCVTALHLREDYDQRTTGPNLRDRERRAAEHLVKWCSSNIRPVPLVIGETTDRDPTGQPFPADESLPVREGFAERRPVRWQRCKWASIGLNAERLQPDQTWAALNAWDMRRDSHWWNLRTNDYYARTAAPLRLPMIIENDPNLRNPPPGAYIGPGRLYNMHRLPPDLWDIIVACKNSDETPCGNCIYCATRLFYDRFCRGKTLADIFRIEEAVERVGCYGRWATDANPATWTHGSILELMRDHARWETFFKEEAADLPPPVRTPPAPAAAPRRELAVYSAGVLTQQEIDEVRSFALALPADTARIDHGGRPAVDETIRKSTLRWLRPSQHSKRMGWLFARISADIHVLNDQYFGVDLFRDQHIDLQITNYAPGCHYAPHVDMALRVSSAAERKLGFSMLLSKHDEFEGGELLIEGEMLNGNPQRAPGTLIAFPSYVRHEIQPVSHGTRISLAGWYQGPLWR